MEYKRNTIRMRHYGHLIELAMETVERSTNPREQADIITSLLPRMRYCITTYKNDTPSDSKLAHDIAFYTHDVVSYERALDIIKGK